MDKTILAPYRYPADVSGPPPKVSPDGKFYWDGKRWVPFQGVAATPPTGRRGCNRFVVLGGFVLLVLIVAIAGGGKCGGGGVNRPTPQIDLSGRMSHQAKVGAEDAVSLIVTNKGPGDFETLVVYLNSKDDWFKHHVITDPSGCTINKDLERLECGQFKVGETKTINIVGSPKDAGNFDFQVAIVDKEGSNLYYPDLDAISWSEAVTP